MKQFVILSILFISAYAHAQKAELNNGHYFKDGIYLSLQNFTRDSPAYSMEECQIEEQEGGDFNFKQYLLTISRNDTVSEKLKGLEIWGVCVDGKPYINCTYLDSMYSSRMENTKKRFLLTFSRIQTIGAICFFATPKLRGFSPGNFGVGVAGPNGVGMSTSPARSQPLAKEFDMMLLPVNTGHVAKFTPENLRICVADDADIVAKLDAAKKPKEQMFILLKEYNNKHRYYIN